MHRVKQPQLQLRDHVFDATDYTELLCANMITRHPFPLFHIERLLSATTSSSKNIDDHHAFVPQYPRISSQCIDSPQPPSRKTPYPSSQTLISTNTRQAFCSTPNLSISNHATMRTTLLPLLLALLPPTLSAPALLSLSAHHNPSISHHPAPTLPAKHIFSQHHHTPTPPPLPFLDPLGLISPSKAARPHKAPPPHKALKPPKPTPKKVFKLPKPLPQPTPTSKVWAVAPMSGQRFGSGPEPGM